MNRYIEVAKITFKSQIIYRFNVISGVFLSFAGIILAYILWKAVFGQKNEIAGFSFSMMVTYYIAVAFFRRLDTTDSIVWQISSEIREGQFTKYIVKPMKPFYYFVAICYSKSAFVLGINGIATVLYAAVFSKYFILHTNYMAYVYSALISLFGLYFLMLLNYFIAILSFKFLDVGAFNMIKNNILEFLTGAIIPLALLPGWIQDGMKFFPFYYIYYMPTMLFMNRETDNIQMAFIVLAIWITVMQITVSIAYNALKKDYEGVGI
ncbi:MAG: ABC-2 family transporter protein [Clostridia bacterium]|nr:ABC-2 family transporter protein [Clostridia bacterium]